MTVFGNLIGYGDYGFVYEDETELNGPDGSVVKIVNLENICNEQQYNMFNQIMNHQNQGIRTPGLPFVFQTFRGTMNQSILNILSYATTDSLARRRVRETFKVNDNYGIIVMERLPCIAQNQFCGRNLKDKGNVAEEQAVYESMVTYLYHSGWWVRDLIDPRNIGYNIHGEPVWFDPMVARRKGFPGFNITALEECHEEVVAYPTAYRQAIESGEYFKQRHGYGLFHSESMNEYMYTKRYGWKVGGRDNLHNRNNDFPISINFAHHNYKSTSFRGRQNFEGLGDLFGADFYVSRDYPPCYLCGKPAKLDVMTAVGRRQFCGNRCRGEYEGVDYGEYPSEELEHSLEIVNYYPGYRDWDYVEDSTIDIRCRNCDWRTSQSHHEHNHTWDSTKQSFYRLHPTNTLPVFDEDGDLEGYEECNHDIYIIKYLGREEYQDALDPRAGNIVVGCRKCNFKDTLEQVDIPAGCSNRGREKPLDFSRFFGSERWDDIEWTTTEPPRKAYEEWADVEWDNKYGSVTGIFYSPAGRIGLQLRSQLVLSPNTWSGISGFLDAGESPYDAVVREIHEESGLPIDRITQWKHRVIWDDGSHRTYLFYVDTEFEPEVNEFKWEWDDWRWDTLDSWKRVSNLHPGMEAALNLTQQRQ